MYSTPKPELKTIALIAIRATISTKPQVTTELE